MSYFFNEGISFLRDFEKNLRGVADSAAKMIEKKENPDVDFRMAKRTALNMIDGLRVATDSVELVHFQSQKDRRNREAAMMDAEFKRDMVEERRIRDAKREKAAAEAKAKEEYETYNCNTCGVAFHLGDLYYDKEGTTIRRGSGPPPAGPPYSCKKCQTVQIKRDNPDNSRVIPDPVCCFCFTPFKENEACFTIKPGEASKQGSFSANHPQEGSIACERCYGEKKRP